MPDLSKEIQTAIEDGVEIFQNLIAKSYQDVASFSKDKTAPNRYIGSLINRYNCVQVLGMREPVPLKSLYVRANILEKISSRAGLLPDDLAEFFDVECHGQGSVARRARRVFQLGAKQCSQHRPVGPLRPSPGACAGPAAD